MLPANKSPHLYLLPALIQISTPNFPHGPRNLGNSILSYSPCLKLPSLPSNSFWSRGIYIPFLAWLIHAMHYLISCRLAGCNPQQVNIPHGHSIIAFTHSTHQRALHASYTPPLVHNHILASLFTWMMLLTVSVFLLHRYQSIRVFNSSQLCVMWCTFPPCLYDWFITFSCSFIFAHIDHLNDLSVGPLVHHLLLSHFLGFSVTSKLSFCARGWLCSQIWNLNHSLAK